MDLQQAIQQEDALIELVDAEMDDICLTCGQRFEVKETSTGRKLIICKRCDSGRII